VDTKEDYDRAVELYKALSSLENPEERYLGPAIIETYKKLFPGPGAGTENGTPEGKL
jgi:hypothetical protein